MAKKLTSKKAREILHDKSVHGHPLTDKQRRFFGAIAGGAPMKAQTGLEYSDDLDYFGTYDAINKKGDYTKERQSVINQLSNLPIYSPEQRYMDYQTVLPYWKSNVQNVPIQTGNKTPAGGSAYYSYNAPPLGATKPYEGTVQLDPRQFGGLQTPERVLEHELRHAAFDGRHFIPQFYGEALHSTSRKPQEFYEGAHENLLNERAVMALGTRKAIIDKYGLKPDAKIPRELFDAYNRETLETGLRSDAPPMQFSDIEESFRGARSASDVYDLINFNTPKKENGGWLDKYGEGGTMQEYQENYNDNTTSYPPGFVGMGNNTKGRNYSPAWGGQFQNGGTSFFSIPQEDPEMMYTDRFNTPLNKEETEQFNKWVAKESERQGRDIMMDKGAYDVQGFWKSGDYKKMDKDNHGVDTWKKPNHPTFSNQSKYHGIDGFYGGNWTEEGGYQPSKQTASMYGPSYYDRMFAEEPDRIEHLDASRYRSGVNKPSPLYFAMGGNLPQAQRGISCPTNVSGCGDIGQQTGAGRFLSNIGDFLGVGHGEERRERRAERRLRRKERRDSRKMNNLDITREDLEKMFNDPSYTRVPSRSFQSENDYYNYHPYGRTYSPFLRPVTPRTGPYYTGPAIDTSTTTTTAYPGQGLGTINDNSIVSRYISPETNTPENIMNQGRLYNGVPGGVSERSVLTAAMGASIPGAVGFTYARTHSPAPSEGPYAKKTLPSAQKGKEITYTHEPGQRGAYRLQRTVIPYTSNRDIKRFTEAPTDPRQVNFLQNYAGAISGYQDDPDFVYPTQVPIEGDKHWNIDRFIIDPQFTKSTPLSVNTTDLEQNRKNVLADMYKYYLLQDPEHRGRAFRKAKRFVRNEIDPRTKGPFLQSFNTRGEENVDPFYSTTGIEGFTSQNKLKDLYWNEATGQGSATPELIDKLKNVSLDYFRNYKKMSKKEAEDQWKKWEEEANLAKQNDRYVNGGSMSYYQHGLDWKPKSISKNGGWLEKYEVPKNQNAQFVLPNPRDLVRQNMGSNESTSLGTKIDEAAIRQAQIDKARRNQGTIKEAGPKRSAASKAWAIATHPMTALAYKVKGQDIPENFERGEINPLEYATDIINPATYLQAGQNATEGLATMIARPQTIGDQFLPTVLNAAAIAPLLHEIPGFSESAQKFGSTIKDIPRARNIREAIGRMGGVPLEKDLPRMAAQDVKALRQVQEIGRLRATNSSSANQMKYALENNLPEEHFQKVFGRSRDEAQKLLDTGFGQRTSNLVQRPQDEIDQLEGFGEDLDVAPTELTQGQRNLMNELFGDTNVTGVTEEDISRALQNNEIQAQRESMRAMFRRLDAEEEGRSAGIDIATEPYTSAPITSADRSQRVRDIVSSQGLDIDDLVRNSTGDELANFARNNSLTEDEIIDTHLGIGEARNINPIDRSERIQNVLSLPGEGPVMDMDGLVAYYHNQNFNQPVTPARKLSQLKNLPNKLDQSLENFFNKSSQNYPYYSGRIQEKVPSLFLNESGLKNVSKRVNFAPEGIKSGDVFTGSKSTSHSSYLPQLKQVFKYTKGDPQFLGYKPMNTLGFLSGFGYEGEDIAKYLNSEIDEQIKRGVIPKNIQRPFQKGEHVMLPHYGIKQHKKGGVIEDDMGQWAHPGKITKINSNQITMKGVDYPVLGISDAGDKQMMYPDQEYTFKGNTVTEYPQKKKNGGWLEKYN